MKSDFTKMLIGITVACLLCGCQKSPEESPVISKNDGSFDINVIQPATQPSESQPTLPSESLANEDETVETVPTSEPIQKNVFQHQAQFSSTDGTVLFSMDIHEEFTDVPMPVVEVVPHQLTEADAQRVAEILLGNSDYYEADPMFAETLCKEEIQTKIDRWLAYEGSAGIDRDVYLSARNSFIEQYTLMMESAPQKNSDPLCQWTYKKATYYIEAPEDAAKKNTADDNDEIIAKTTVNGIPYKYTVSKRDASDFKLNNIYVEINDGISPLSVDYYLFRNQLCATEKPNQENIDAAIKKASNILDQMQLGEWYIDEYYVETIDREPTEYTIIVTAVPMFENVAALRRPQLTNLKSKETYASNYYLSNVKFTFNISGDLVAFEMFSPIDVTSVINANVQTLSFDELIERAKSHLSLSDYFEYDYLGCLYSGIEDYNCYVNITEAQYGLTRVKVPNTDESYYYVPAMIFWGSVQFEGKESGEVYDMEAELGEINPLLILNAIDGSVINATNE
jgi:hypothetical protein